MSIRNRLKNIEQIKAANQSAWVQGLSEDELKRVAVGGNPLFSEWLETLTDDELLIIRDGKTGAAELRSKYYEFEKQN